jgi:hypothetical protein
MPGAEIVNGAPEAWSLGYVSDVILTRGPVCETGTDPGASRSRICV